MSPIPFSDLRVAAYCPRKLYYERRRPVDERAPPPEVDRIRSLAYRYDDLLEASDEELAAEPIALSPAAYRDNLERARRTHGAARRSAANAGRPGADTRRSEADDRGPGPAAGRADDADRRDETDRWADLCDPPLRDVLVTGRECRGIVHKVLEDPLEPSLISPGAPPDSGVWAPHTVHAVAAAKALAWERETPVESAAVEYPAHGVIRRIDLTTRRKARYRKTVRTVRSIDGPPPRIRNRAKCDPCEHAGDCGVRTRTLRSLLGLE